MTLEREKLRQHKAGKSTERNSGKTNHGRKSERHSLRENLGSSCMGMLEVDTQTSLPQATILLA
jgi:hypothetical protein